MPTPPYSDDVDSLTRHSKSDYCSSLLAGVSSQLLSRLQTVFNAAARMIYSSRRSEHITPLLRELHHSVLQRIQFRLCVLTYRCLHGTDPAYLSESLHSVADIDARRRLRSADTSTLLVPSVIEHFQLLRHAPGTAFPFTGRQHCLRSAGSLRLICAAVLLTNSNCVTVLFIRL